jgi:Spinocerebellar ataxia type 10 protein domain
MHGTCTPSMPAFQPPTATEDLSEGCVDWTALLNRTRQLLNGDESCASAAMELTLPQVARLGLLLQEYAHLLAYSDSQNDALSRDDKKRFLLDTRAALRIALCVSTLELEEKEEEEENEDQVRDQLLTEAVAVQAWHQPLARIVSSHRGDPKTRVLASQLLSNLVTKHPPSAKIITSFLALSPSQETVVDRLWERITTTTTTTNNDDHLISMKLQPNWADMMLACVQTHNRPALAATVAAMHNAIVSLQKHPTTCSSSNSDSDSDSDKDTFVNALTADQMVMNTLLRQIVPVQSIITSKEARDASVGPGDSATEWISLLLIKCCKCGQFPTMYAAIYSQTEQPLEISVFPEHMVLLQFLHSQMDTPGETQEVPLLGGEAGSQGVISTHLFLANLYSSLRQPSFPREHSPAASPDWSMKEHAMATILETLASSLGQEGDFIASARSQLGKEDACALIPDAGIHLGTVLDDITQRNQGRKSRDFIMFDNEKQLVTALVQLLANACFRCRKNQDLLRFTRVPPPPAVSSGPRESEQERNVLHVLLSCTGLAHSCFTLREWAVIAIRNALDNNEANQAEVARLEANQPVQTAELASMGIRVDMDSRGNVSVVPNDGGDGSVA